MRIRILSPADGQDNAFTWGDYWVKKELETEFASRGYTVVDEGADLDFCLFGAYQPLRRMDATRRFCWVYSHPDFITKQFDTYFEHVFVLSRIFMPKIKNSTVLFGASSKQPVPRNKEAGYDLIFMGNAGKPKRKEVIEYLCGLEKYRILLVGDWAKLSRFGGVDYGGMYVNNGVLGKFFNRGLLSLYIAHEDMRVNGFVAVRILDIFRSSSNLCISDSNPGLRDMLPSVPVYKNKEELADLIDWYLRHSGIREDIIRVCRKDAEQWTFGKVVDEIERWV